MAKNRPYRYGPVWADSRWSAAVHRSRWLMAGGHYCGEGLKMSDYLPRTVAIGDKLRLVPYALDKQDNGSEHCQKPHALTGQMIYIHPRQLFATVRFPLAGYGSTGHQVDKELCEVWPVMPDERRPVHADSASEPKKPVRKDKRPITVILQERDWSDATSTTSAGKKRQS